MTVAAVLQNVHHQDAPDLFLAGFAGWIFSYSTDLIHVFLRLCIFRQLSVQDK